jgi:hypothetical protein
LSYRPLRPCEEDTGAAGPPSSHLLWMGSLGAQGHGHRQGPHPVGQQGWERWHSWSDLQPRLALVIGSGGKREGGGEGCSPRRSQATAPTLQLEGLQPPLVHLLSLLGPASGQFWTVVLNVEEEDSVASFLKPSSFPANSSP